jgi:hypothetical protein
MSEQNKYDFLKGDRAIYYVFLPIIFLVIEIYNKGLSDVDYLGYVVSTSGALLVLEGLNWTAKKFNIWLDTRRETKKAKMRKV